VRRDLVALAARQGGVLTRDAALQIGPRHVIDDAVAAGVFVRLFPSTYVLADVAGDRRVQQRAALAFVPGTALSHLDALDRWGLLPAETFRLGPLPLGRLREGEPIRLTAPAAQGEVDTAGLRVTRRIWFRLDAPMARRREGTPLVRLEQAVVESWSLLPSLDRRTPLIVALRDRRTRAERLLSVLDVQPKTTGARELRTMIALVSGGCHSELELWGHQNIFTDRRLPASRRQVAVDTPTGRVYLDRYYDEEMVDVEMDGAAYHGAPGQRERDLRRDAALARLGILAVRYSHPRLHRQPEQVITELAATLRTRRDQLRGWPRAG
jgi:very-short-patch-repair endonuclease